MKFKDHTYIIGFLSRISNRLLDDFRVFGVCTRLVHELALEKIGKPYIALIINIIINNSRIIDNNFRKK
jgi:hypothetical protein